MMYATQKDIDRASRLNWRGNTFCVIGGEIAISNAIKMAKLIKDPHKILARFEAVAEKWGDDRIRIPFITRICELHPNSGYTTAKAAGSYDGRYTMSPIRGPYSDNRIECIIYNIYFNRSRRGCYS